MQSFILGLEKVKNKLHIMGFLHNKINLLILLYHTAV